MDTQTVFDATAQKLYTDYIDAGNELAHAQCAMDVTEFIANNRVIPDLPPLPNPVETSVAMEVETDCQLVHVDQVGMRKLFIAARLLNEVLKPQMFKSDWRVKLEKKQAAKKKSELKSRHSRIKASH